MYNKKEIFWLLIFFTLLLSACGGNQPPATEVVPTATLNLYGNFKIQIPDKALIKNYLVVSLETEPATTCELTYIAPKGRKLYMVETADEKGQCEWRWKLEETDGRGHGRLIFTINGISETRFIDVRPEF